MTTIKAMKQTAVELKTLQRAISRNPGLGFNVQPSIITELDEAIAREEAQTVVARVKRLTNCSIIDSTGCAVRWEDLPDGTELFTHPAAAPSGERATNVALLRMCVEHLRATGRIVDDEGEVTDQIEQAADMRAADHLSAPRALP